MDPNESFKKKNLGKGVEKFVDTYNLVHIECVCGAGTVIHKSMWQTMSLLCNKCDRVNEWHKVV